MKSNVANISRFVHPGILTTAGWGLALLWLNGCALGPDYQRPSVTEPPDWRWKIAEPKDRAPRGAWWKVFQDPALDAAEQAAVAGNFDVKAAVARVEQARAVARIDRAQFYPALNAQASFVRYRTSGNSPSPVPFPVPSFRQSQWSVPFDLSYEIDLWGRVRRSFDSAQQMALAAEAARQSILLSLQADVAVAYFSLQSVRREIDLLTQAIRVRKEALQIFEQRTDAGIGSKFEVERGRVEVAAAEADLHGAHRRQAEWINALALLSGQASAVFAPVIGEVESPLPQIAPDVPSALLERRPDIAQAERELASRLAQIGVAKAAFFPSIRLTATGGVLSGDVSDLFLWDSRTWSFGPQIRLPLFEGGRNKAGLERARAAYEESVALYRQKVLGAFREVEDSLSALQFLQPEAESRREGAEAAALAAKLSLERYRAGAVNFLEVVDSENARLLNELARVRVAQEQRIATVRLVKALGGGWEQPAP